MRAWAFIVALLSPLAAGADGAQAQGAASGMIKFVSIWEQPNDDATLDKWYRATHSREVLLFVGPWLRRYWAYKSLDVPAEADRFNVVRYRLTEMWYESVAARNESRAVFYPLSPPPVDRERYPTRTRIANIYVSAVPTDAYIDGWPRSRAAYTRWVFFARYPHGIRPEDGDKWFTSVHAPELSRLPGLRRFVCFRAVEAPRPDSWARMCEMWFDDYAAWKRAILTAPPVFTPPQWGGSFPFTDMISTFTPTEPDMDFRRDSDGPR